MPGVPPRSDEVGSVVTMEVDGAVELHGYSLSPAVGGRFPSRLRAATSMAFALRWLMPMVENISHR